MTVALCLITWNEIDGVKHDIPLIDRTRFEQIYCVDGGSTDGTVEFLQASGIPVYRQTAKGLNQACIDGVNNCECDAFVFFIQNHKEGVEVAIGSLYIVFLVLLILNTDNTPIYIKRIKRRF